MSPRELGDERKRYGTKSIGERLDDILAWPAEHRILTTVLIAFIVVGLLLSVARGLHVDPESLVVGDCLFVRTATEPIADRPIGDDREVAAAVLAGQAERASCSDSHGHEVSAIVVVDPLPTLCTPVPPCDMPSGILDSTAIDHLTRPKCEAAFASYVGRPLAGSTYTTFPAAPDANGAEAWIKGGMLTICLVSRLDGQWMDHSARGSGE